MTAKEVLFLLRLGKRITLTNAIPMDLVHEGLSVKRKLVGTYHMGETGDDNIYQHAINEDIEFIYKDKAYTRGSIIYTHEVVEK